MPARLFIWFWLLPLLAVAPKSLLAQAAAYSQSKFTISDGLPDNYIYDFYQDSLGFIWMATRNGLSRYDGYKFKNLVYDLRDSTSLPDINVLQLLPDSDGRLWTIGPNSLARINDCGDGVDYRRYPLFEQVDNAICATTLSGGKWLFCSSDSCLLFEPSEIGYQKLFLTEAPWSQIYTMYQDKNGTLWIGAEEGLFQAEIREASNTLVFQEVMLYDSVAVKNVKDIFEDSAGDIWIAGRSGVFIGKAGNRKITPFKGFSINGYELNEELGFSSITEGEKERIWLANGYMLWSFNKRDKELDSLKLTATIQSILAGQSGNVWVATAGGLTKLKDNAGYFHHYHYEPPVIKGAKNDIVFDITEGHLGHLWFVGWGLHEYDPVGKQFWWRKYLPAKRKELPSYALNSILRGRDGSLWIGTFDKGLIRVDKSYASLKLYESNPRDSTSIGHNVIIRALKEDRDGDIWIAHRDGISIHRKQSDDFLHIQIDSSGKDFYALCVNQDGIGWAGGAMDGLFRLDKKTAEYEKMELPYETALSVIHEDIKTPHLWLGTFGNGLWKYNPSSGKVEEIYTDKDGLGHNSVYGILQDNGGLWMSIDNAIVKFDPEEKLFTHYGKTYGQPLVSFANNSFYKASDGAFYFGGIGGALSFYPDSLQKNSTASEADIVITSLKVFESEQCFAHSTIDGLAGAFSTYTDSNFIKFEFAKLNFEGNNRNKYQFKLDGWDQEWSVPIEENFARYTNLPAGHYRFRVRSIMEDGTWSDKEAELRLSVLPVHFWEHKWFYPLAFLLTFGSLALGLGLWRRNKARREKEKQRRKIEQLRTTLQSASIQALRSQMNPHFLFNILNSANLFLSENDTLGANRLLADFSRLMRHMLDNSKKDYISLSEELAFLRLYLQFEHFRFKKDFDYQLAVEPSGLATDTLKVPSMVIQPFIENAIRHGLRKKKEKGMLWVCFEKKPGQLICTIEDNGIGRAASEIQKTPYQKKRSSTGIDNVRRRLVFLNDLYPYQAILSIADLVDENQQALGTKVTLTFELGENDHSKPVSS